MADRYLKFSYDITVSYTAGNYRLTLTSGLPASAFPNNNLRYSMNYGTGDIYANVRLPAKLRLYQKQLVFRDTNLYSLMSTGSTDNYVDMATTPTAMADYYVDPTSSVLQWNSDVGTETTYTDTVYEYPNTVNCTHDELSMRSQLTPSVSGTATITWNNIFMFHDNETTEYDALLAAYPNNVTTWSPYPARDRLYIGDDPVDKLYMGNNQISKIYFRNEVIKE